MNPRRILAIAVIFALASTGWWILGTTTAYRSDGFARRLGNEVAALWGAPLVQPAPAFTAEIPGADRERPVIPVGNDIRVELGLDYRKKGLIWYPTYTCDFRGVYTIHNAEPVARKIRVHFDFPAAGATYDDFTLLLNDAPVDAPVDTEKGMGEILELPPDGQGTLTVRYRTRGMGFWRYLPDREVGRVRNLDLEVRTDFQEVDFTGLSPMASEPADGGMTLRWQATDLITAADIGVVVPERLNPGPVTSRITFFAPVCLIFFFVLIATFNVLYGIDIHPMHYLFVAAGFFAFHLLLAYLVDHLGMHGAFFLSAGVSVGLVTFYLSAALGKRFPWKLAAAGQVFYLVLFSYSFFLKGMTGLTVAIGSVATLAALMKVTAGVDWEGVFSKSEGVPAARS